jgi:hypothetical protein
LIRIKILGGFKMIEASTPERGNQERLCRLYVFLLSKTDLGDDMLPNESLVAYQWGLENYRVFVRKVLRAVYPNQYSNSSDSVEDVLAPSIELHKLTSILDSIQKYQSGERDKYRKRKKQLSSTSRLTKQDKLMAINLYSELSEWERNTLGLPMDEEGKLVAQLLNRLQCPTVNASTDLLKQLYGDAIESHLSVTGTETSKESSEETSIDDEIRHTIKRMLLDQYYFSNEDSLNRETKRYHDIVNRELYRIICQSGLQQLIEIPGSKVTLMNVIKGLSDEIVSRLVCSIVENEMLTRKFPIFIKWIDVERVRPLPLRIYREEVPDGLLSEALIDPTDGVGITGLENQMAYKVTVYFRIREIDALDSDHKPQDFNSRFLEFSEEITGVGSPISLATVAINRVLLWDVPCLREKNIFPVAKQILLHNKVLQSNPHKAVWCHTVVQLHTCQAMELAIQQKNKADDFDIFLAQSHGDFCGFDVLEVIAKSGVHARLRAIQQLGIDPILYLKELRNKVEESQIIKKAKSYVKFYPFSFWAMEGTLEEELFKRQENILEKDSQENKQHFYRTKIKINEDKIKFEDTEPNKEWSLLAYNAHLALAEVLLMEGKQEAAKCYLDAVQNHVERNQYILTDLMKARYHYLMARYHFLYDLEDPAQRHSGRSNAILVMRQEIDKARECLKHRIEMCEVIGELSQSNIHPFFSLLGKINFLEARLYLGFCSYLNVPYPENIKQVLIRLQTARVCAARDGSADEYAYYSAFQSWVYSMFLYSDEDKLMESLDLDSEKCHDWSKRLIRHAIICYGDTGNKSYETIKMHAGDSDPIPYGKIKIPKVPFIQEYSKETPRDNTSNTMNNDDFMQLPYFSLFEFEVTKSRFSPRTEVLLFGTNSSILLFALGMQKLSSLKEDNKNISEDLIHVFQYLLAAYATAKDGGHNSPNSKGENRLIERSKDTLEGEHEILKIRKLYLLRIGYIVPSTILALCLCSISRLIYSHHRYAQSCDIEDRNRLNNEISEFQRIRDELLEDLHEGSEAGGSHALEGTNQKRFNGYIKSHLARVKKYYENVVRDLKLMEVPENTTDTSEYSLRWKSPENHHLKWRNKLMKNLLRLIVGVEPDMIK